MFKTTAIDTLKQDKKCQACWYIILSTMSGSTTTNDAREATHSVIGIPGQAPIRDRFRNLDLMNINIVPGQKLPIAGVAFAGDRGISKVEVSTDGGATRKSASIKDPLSKYTWVLWTTGFILPAVSGNYKIVVRATDSKSPNS